MKKFILFLLICSLVMMPLSLSVSASENDPSAVLTISQTDAESHVLMDADSLDLLSSANPDLALPMASTTKIMTCLIALEQMDPSDKIRVPDQAVGIEGSSVYLCVGEELTLHDLLYALMLESANDAAVAIALTVADQVGDFVGLMNEKAAELGMQNTHFANPHGLPQEDHFSSARDLAILMREAMRNEVFREITGTATKSIPAPDGKTRFLSNHNKLLRSYEGCIGGKTGYTKEAGRCLVTVCERNGKSLICVTLGDPDDWKDHQHLYEYGYSLYVERPLATEGSLQRELLTVGADVSTCRLVNRDSFMYPIRTEDTLRVVYELPPFVYAPATTEMTIGYAVYVLNGTEIARLPLYLEEDLSARCEKLSLWEKICHFIESWFR